MEDKRLIELSEVSSNRNEIKVFCPKCNTEVLHSAEGIQEDQTKILVAKVYHYFEQEYEELKKMYGDLDLTPLSKFRQRTALATGVSETTLLQILKEEEERNVDKRQEPPQIRRSARKRRRKTDRRPFGRFLFEEDCSDGNVDEQPRHADKTFVVKIEPPEDNNEEPEIFLPSVKVEPSDGDTVKEPTHPIALDVKTSPRADEMDTTNETLALNEPADRKRKLWNISRNSDDTSTQYHKNRENNRKHPAEKSIVEDLLNLNTDFEMMEDKEIKKDYDNVTNKTTMNEYDSNIYFNHASTSYNTIDDTEAIETDGSKIIATNENLTTIPETESQTGETLISLSLVEFNRIITENSGLQAEKKILKESNLKVQNLKEETDRGFKAIQVQLDKLYDILKHKQSNIETAKAAGTSVSTKFDEELAQRNIEFPINSIKNLELLEDQLIDTDFEKVLVKHYSRICGTSGMLQILIKDWITVNEMFVHGRTP